MEAVPSLVGTGTIVAAAVTGLVFAQADRPQETRPSSNKRRLTSDFGSIRLPSSLRPATSSGPVGGPPDELPYHLPPQFDESFPSPLFSHPPNVARPRPSNSQLTPPKTTSRRQSFMRQNDRTARPIAENARDSISSNGSWMKRLSIRPLSQHGSPRSSMGPDAPSLFSHGSSAPMLSPSGSATPQLPPNKLVKRGASVQSNSPATMSRRASRSQMPTLRRPATSHQRSATLQQFQAQGGFLGPPQAPKFSLDQQLRPMENLPPAEDMDAAPTEQEINGWMSFFHSRAIKRVGRGSSDSPNVVPGPNKRVQLPFGGKPRAYLVKAGALTGTAVPPAEMGCADDCCQTDESPQTKGGSPSSADETPTKRARRSISMHFASPTSWISKTGSVRRSKRGSNEANPTGKRNVSDPTTSSPIAGQPEAKTAAALDQIFIPYQPRQQLEPESASNYHPKARKRNSSSPLPPLSRLSSFNVDVSRVGLTTASSSSGARRPSHMSATLSAGPHIYPSMSESRAVSGERASTVVSSDLENHFTSGDDDDTDGRSDTMYDSFRTGASTRLRTVETPLGSMFDESPPSTAGNSKTKRLSIQEILGRSWDGDTNIMEEDESISTPIRASHTHRDLDIDDRPLEEGYSHDRTSHDLAMAHRDFARLSLDDDEDDDWARDDDNALSNHLSPPTSSLTSRRASPNLRHALASISGNNSGDRYSDAFSERPRSNVFDWSEPLSHDKFEVDGHSPRPKTVHGKQELDLRGGRPANRKGPAAAHVRSQSVPVVPDPSDSSKIVPKFGTWGMGTKNVSEDWDDDFDLDEEFIGPVGAKDSATSFSMVVPPSIQAIQHTVKAHSGQIRELSLLVNDLKRLCRHGKDLDITDGSSAAKWREAENIIELAAPDDEDEGELKPPAEPVDEFDASSVDERFLDEGFDAACLEHKPSYGSFSVQDPEMCKTAVVRERLLVRRRSVFSPEDDIFGNSWPLSSESGLPNRPRTPDQPRNPNRDSAVISIVMEAMQQQRSASESVRRRSPVKPSQSKLFFDTNSLQELVKRASHLRDALSDIVRKAELLTQSPVGTPRRERQPRLADGSPAFTRVFSDPASSPPKRLPKSHSANTVLSRASVESSRMQMMTVS